MRVIKSIMPTDRGQQRVSCSTVGDKLASMGVLGQNTSLWGVGDTPVRAGIQGAGERG